MNIININDTSNKLFYIGGVVRDELLNKQSIDIDITYVGNAIEYCSKFGEVIQINPDFGTVRVKIPSSPHREIADFVPSTRSGHNVSEELNNVIVDFASTRSETYPKKGHLPVVEKIGCSLKEDVLRRDFTINALAKSITTGEIVDYVGGLKDLKNKKLRVLHDNSFIDDPTRIIRGLKFAMRFNFELEEHTKKLQDEYLKNINYDMSYKRIKKELIETFNAPLSNITKEYKKQRTFEKFINEKIYKLVTPNDVEIPSINIEELIEKYCLDIDCHVANTPRNDEHIWLIYVGVLKDLSRLPLTKIEQKILDDVPQNILNSDFELYKTFENAKIETILLYAILKDQKGAKHYLDNLRNIKISINGKDLQNLGISPSPQYQEIFDEVLKAKLQNPKMTKEDELKIAKSYSSC
ncbi:tRNA nucleotidyltransferase/poly(A) polymerase [Clostridium sp. CAG:715]|nr:tRNA nucleotidyltransferase/poly(A) polymerase [Clostridium sp. CAG:715]